MRPKKIHIIIFIVIGILGSASISFADNRAFWVEGEVTRVPYRIADEHHMIEVDGAAYRIPPDIRITYRYLRNEGAYNERSATVDSIAKGQKITMKVRKKKVIQIILF